MIKKITLVLIVLPVFFIASCEKYDLERKDFLIEISTDEITVSNADIIANGTIIALGKGVQNHGHVWAKTIEPTVDDNKNELGPTDLELSYSSEINDLEFNTIYHIRAYAFDGEEYFYGDEATILTSDALAVSTDTAEIINYSATKITGTLLSIDDNSVIQHGHCWSTTNSNPSTTDSKTELGVKSQLGSIESSLTGLDMATIYYYRTYAQTDNDIAYGAVKTFEIPLPTVVTTNVTNNGKINNFGAYGKVLSSVYDILNLDEYGFCWSFSNNTPTISDDSDFTTTVDNLGSFTIAPSNLTVDTAYYIRAYVKIGGEIVYGDIINFETRNIWVQKPNFGGTRRYEAVGFSIGDKGYIGTGYDENYDIKKDLWEYDVNTETWTQKADLPGLARTGAVGFSIAGKGYIGTGSSAGNNYLKDFWEYDPSANSWTQKTQLGGVSRRYAASFTIGDKAYVGTGYAGAFNYYNDFWEYDPSTNAWTQKANFSGSERWSCIAFSIGTKGYLGTGWEYGGSNGSRKKDFWEYDSGSNTWTQKTNAGITTRNFATGFSIGNKGYVGTGYGDNQTTYKDLLEYDPSTDSWMQKSSFEGPSRSKAVSFVINDRGYVGTGYDSATSTRYSDFWEYIPN